MWNQWECCCWSWLLPSNHPCFYKQTNTEWQSESKITNSQSPHESWWRHLRVNNTSFLLSTVIVKGELCLTLLHVESNKNNAHTNETAWSCQFPKPNSNTFRRHAKSSSRLAQPLWTDFVAFDPGEMAQHILQSQVSRSFQKLPSQISLSGFV